METLKEQLDRLNFQKFTLEPSEVINFPTKVEQVYENSDDESEKKDLINPTGEALSIPFIFRKNRN
jgi:hypothetical protein